MNNTSKTFLLEAAASMSAALNSPDILNAPRALLVSLDDKGNLQHQPINMGQSVVNLQTELIDHLNSFPFTDVWLSDLRDYLDGRIAARAEAKRTGGFVVPRAPGMWEIAHAPAFEPLSAHGVN